MITIFDAAQAANAIYDSNDFPNFKFEGGCVDPKNEDTLGFEGIPNASSFKRVKFDSLGSAQVGYFSSLLNPKHVILCFRGTMGNKDIFDDDASIVLNKVKNARVDRAEFCIDFSMEFKNNFGKDKIILITGHSLGGFLAQVVGLATGLPFVSFNAPGASNYVRNHDYFKNKLKSSLYNGVNFRVNFDPVSYGAGDHIGPVITLPHHGWAIHKAHVCEEVLKSVDRNKGIRNQPAIAFVGIQTKR